MEDLSKVVPTSTVLPSDWRPTKLAILHLLQTVDSHADDLKTILFAANPQLPQKAARAVARQIDETFEELVGRPFMQIRHHGAQLEIRYCQAATFTVYGYFVADADPRGVIGPSERAHGSSGRGWTFTMTVRRLLAQIVRTSKLVEHNIQLPTVTAPLLDWGEKEARALKNIAEWLARSPPWGFGREVTQIAPAISVRDGQPHMRLQTVVRTRSVESLPTARWGVTYSGDGTSRSFSIL